MPRPSLRCLAAITLLLGACADAPGFAPPDCAVPWPDGADADTGADTAPPAPALEGFGLPVLAICADPAAFAALEAHPDEHDALEIPVTVDFAGHRYAEVEIELHGGFARTVAKKSYRLSFEDDDAIPFPFDDEAAPAPQRHLVLQASWIDPTWLRNDLTYAAVRALGGLAPRTGFAVVYVNGERRGLYQIIERVDRPYLARLGLDRDGNVYKAVDHRANWVAKPHPLDGYEHKVNEDNPTDDLGPLLAACTSTPLDAAAFAAEVEPRLDLDDWGAWQIAHSYALNQDAFTKNYYLYHNLEAAPGTAAARFRIISWDADATWGQNWDGSPIAVTTWPGAGLGVSAGAWHGTDGFAPRLLAIASYRRAYLARYAAALAGPLDAAALDARVVRRGAAIAAAARDDLARWRPEHDFDAELVRLRAALAARHATMHARVAELRDDAAVEDDAEGDDEDDDGQ